MVEESKTTPQEVIEKLYKLSCREVNYPFLQKAEGRGWELFYDKRNSSIYVYFLRARKSLQTLKELALFLLSIDADVYFSSPKLKLLERVSDYLFSLYGNLYVLGEEESSPRREETPYGTAIVNGCYASVYHSSPPTRRKAEKLREVLKTGKIVIYSPYPDFKADKTVVLEERKLNREKLKKLYDKYEKIRNC